MFDGLALPMVAGLLLTDFFAPYQVIHDQRAWAESVAIGDVTGDGRPDVLMSTTDYDDPAADNKLSVYAQQPDGTLAAPVRYATALTWRDQEMYGAAALAVLDTDGDARLDVAMATYAGVQIFRQTAAGTLADAGLVAGSGPAFRLVAADLDNDGDQDLVAGGYHGTRVLTQRARQFTVTTISTAPTTDVAAGDLLGGDRADVVTVYGYDLVVHKRTATGWQAVPHPMALGTAHGPQALEVADFSGDGRADLAVSLSGNLPDGRLNIFTQTPAGKLAKPVTHLTPDSPGALTSGDLDGDGRTDLAVVHDGWSTLQGLLQEPDGTLGGRVFAMLPYATDYNNQGLALGDVNSDGHTDAVIADYNSGLVIVPGTGAPRPAADEHVWIDRSVPAPGAADVPVGTAPTLYFDRPLDPESLATYNIWLDDSEGHTQGGDFTYDRASGAVTFTPAAALRPGEDYTLVIGRVRDANGKLSNVPVRIPFRTAG